MRSTDSVALRLRGRVGLALLSAALVTIAISPRAQEPANGEIHGKVWREQGKPLVAASLLIRAQRSERAFEVSTTEEGEFRHRNLPLGRYELSVRDSAGLFCCVPVRLTELHPVVQVEMNLQKLRAAEREYESFRHDLLSRSQEAREREERELALRSMHNRGVRFLREGQPEDALAEFDRILASDPSREDVSALRASALAAAGRTEEAMALYQDLLIRTPREAANHNNLAILLARAGRIDEAVEHFESAVKMDKRRAGTYHFNLGSALYEAGRFREAVDHFKTSVNKDPTMAVAHFFQGAALLRQGVRGKDRSRAASSLRRYLQLEPEGTYAETARRLLDQMSQGVEQLLLPEAPTEEELEW